MKFLFILVPALIFSSCTKQQPKPATTKQEIKVKHSNQPTSIRLRNLSN